MPSSWSAIWPLQPPDLVGIVVLDGRFLPPIRSTSPFEITRFSGIW